MKCCVIDWRDVFMCCNTAGWKTKKNYFPVITTMHGPTHTKIILPFGSCTEPTRSSAYKHGGRKKFYTGLQTCLIPLKTVVNVRVGEGCGGMNVRYFFQEMSEY